MGVLYSACTHQNYITSDCYNRRRAKSGRDDSCCRKFAQGAITWRQRTRVKNKGGVAGLKCLVSLFSPPPDMCMQKTRLLALDAHQRLFTACRGVCGSGDWNRGFQTPGSDGRQIPQPKPVMSLPSGSRRGRQTQLLRGLEEGGGIEKVTGMERRKQREGDKEGE